jgi:hypothetical protein
MPSQLGPACPPATARSKACVPVGHRPSRPRSRHGRASQRECDLRGTAGWIRKGQKTRSARGHGWRNSDRVAEMPVVHDVRLDRVDGVALGQIERGTIRREPESDRGAVAFAERIHGCCRSKVTLRTGSSRNDRRRRRCADAGITVDRGDREGIRIGLRINMNTHRRAHPCSRAQVQGDWHSGGHSYLGPVHVAAVGSVIADVFKHGSIVNNSAVPRRVLFLEHSCREGRAIQGCTQLQGGAGMRVGRAIQGDGARDACARIPPFRFMRTRVAQVGAGSENTRSS